MLRIRLPYPDRLLNPNTRRVWQASLKPKKEAREVGYYEARQAGDFKGWHLNYTKPLRLRISIHPPDNRRRDWINVVRAIKNYEDGIFDYLEQDDHLIRDVQIKMRRSCPGGRVNYILYQK